jgi:hypothetical protein
VTRPIPACGTTGGYQRHLRLKETPCDECRHAIAAYQRLYRAGFTRARRAPACGTTGGYRRHHANSETPCEPCREANRQRQRDYMERQQLRPAPAFSHPEAACKGADTALFYPDAGQSAAPAIAICRTCPAAAPCLAHALEHRELGVWGGTTAKQRAQLRRSPHTNEERP